MPQENPSNYDLLMNQQMPQGQTEDTNSLYADMIKEEKITNILQQINPDNLMSDIEYRIKGYKKNTLSGEWEKISAKAPEINEEMVSNFMSFLGSILNQNTSMSNFSSGEINSIMEMIVEYVADDLTVNDVKYCIVGNFQEMSRIANIISMSVFSVLKRAQNGMEARRVFSALKISESLTQTPKSPGLKDSLMFWK